MSPEEKITTLILHGCAFYRRPDSGGNDPEMRFIYARQIINAPHLMFSNVGRQAYRWRLIRQSTMRVNIEIPFDPILIDELPVSLILQYSKTLY